MRYFVKAYPMHERELIELSNAHASGHFDGDIQAGLVVGSADSEGIASLTEAGVVIHVIAAIPDELPGVAEVSHEELLTETAGLRPFSRRLSMIRRAAGLGDGLQPPIGQPSYWLADVLLGITDQTIDRLNEAGAQVVERDTTGALVLKVEGTIDRLRELPFVTNISPYAAEFSSLSSAATGEATLSEQIANVATMGVDGVLVEIPQAIKVGASQSVEGQPSLGRFEVICHERADAVGVAEAIELLGGTAVMSHGSIIRFNLLKVDLAQVAAIPGVANISASMTPMLRCDAARGLIGVSSTDRQNSLGLDGSGELVGVADTGLDSGHPDFAGKALQVVALGRPGNSSDPDGHGTHVAGTIAGTGEASKPDPAAVGTYGPLHGVAPAANLYFQSIMDANGTLGGLPESLNDLLQPAYKAGVRIHNNSWGAYIQSRYDGMASEIDQFVHKNPDFLVVIAAGNEGSCRPGFAAAPGFVDLPSLGSPATSKNGITVGASRSSRQEGGYSQESWQSMWPADFNAGPIGHDNISGDPERLAAFSSRGPCDDMRVKPDLVAPGTDIAATRSRSAPLANFWGAYPRNRSYAFMGGTSMAAPIVSGCAALVRQYYRTQRAHERPSAALLKATLINGTRFLSGPDATAAPLGEPNYHQGFGCVDMASTVPASEDPKMDLFFVDTWELNSGFRLRSRGERKRWRIKVEADCTLRICLTWTDPGMRSLTNQLRMILDTQRHGKVHNWVANDRVPSLVTFPAHDPRRLLPGRTEILTRDPANNVQVIRADVRPGVYTLAVFADGLLQPPQDFALVITYPLAAADIKDE